MKRNALLGVVLSSLLMGQMTAEARVSDEQWKDIKKQYNKLMADLETRDKAMRKIGRCDHPASVKLLLKHLANGDRHERKLKSERAKLLKQRFEDAEWRTKAIAKGATFSQGEIDRINKQHAETIKALIKCQKQLAAGIQMRFAAIEGLRTTKDKEALELLYGGAKRGKSSQRTGALSALAQAGSIEGSEKNLRALMKDSDALVAAMALDTVGRLRDVGAVDLMIEQLSGKASWQARCAAAFGMSHFAIVPEGVEVPTEALTKAIKGIIEAMAKEESGRVLEEFDRALRRITGKSFDGDAKKWTEWLASNKDNLGSQIRGEVQTTAATGLPNMANITTRSKRIAIVIDRNYVNAGISSSVNLFLASLPKDAQFTIISFHSKVMPMAPKLVKASSGTVKMAKHFVSQIKSDENYNQSAIHDALDFAMLLGGRTPDKAAKKGIDTLFYVGHGVPSGRIGITSDRSNLFREMVNRCVLRRIRMHVVGAGSNGDWAMLKQLAEVTGGSYSGPKPAGQ